MSQYFKITGKPIKYKRIVFVLVVFLSFFFIMDPVRADFNEEDNKLASLIQRMKPGIVSIGTFYFKDKPMVKFSGTGFVIGKGSRIVTNHHVIAFIREKKQVFNLRIFHKDLPVKGIKAEILAEDKFHDLAILGIQEKTLLPLPLGKERRIKEGHKIAFTGYPIGFILGLHPTTHTGIISAIAPIILPSPSASIINGDLIKHLKKPFDIFQIDAAAYPGNSGSPVYWIATGEVVGVINMVFIKGKKEHVLKEPTGITYAIPIQFVHELNQTIP
ncbi:MAG: serine protease [Desulfobacteraceae bacterium 4572_89]|nr:MAG: serine protease [Desulfobacteraceae bacterium 4572_89]